MIFIKNIQEQIPYAEKEIVVYNEDHLSGLWTRSAQNFLHAGEVSSVDAVFVPAKPEELMPSLNIVDHYLFATECNGGLRNRRNRRSLPVQISEHAHTNKSPK